MSNTYDNPEDYSIRGPWRESAPTPSPVASEPGLCRNGAEHFCANCGNRFRAASPTDNGDKNAWERGDRAYELRDKALAEADAWREKYMRSIAEAARPHDAISCPLCGELVQLGASDTLSLALWQHVNWVCAKHSASMRSIAASERQP